MSKRALCFMGLVISLIVMISSASAQTPEITNGLAYLQSTQSPEGYWGDVSEVPYNSFVDTCTVVETLNYLNETGTAYNSAIQWINTTEVSNDDYLFTQMYVLAQAGYDVSTIRDYLLSVINDDGGWGVVEGFESDVKRTTLALQALKAVNYPDLDTISYALGYLTDNQNADGGWGFYEGDESNVYMTALVLKVLASYNGTFDLQAEIDSAVAYLLTMQNVDGSFGEGTVYEGALAFDALIASGSVGAENFAVMQNAINYLTSTQLPNGSWDDDPYSTALALRALHISANTEPQPNTGTVTGKIVDASTNQPLENVTVISGQLSATTTNTGEFTLSDIPSGSQTITFSLNGYTTATATVDITAGSIINLGTIPLSSNPNTGIIKGTVTDAESSQPMEGVTITVTGSFNGNTVTGTDGSFIFTNVTPGSATLTAEKAGYYTVTGTGTVVAGEILFFNPQLSTQPPPTTTGNLTGKVFDSSTNTPIQGATVSISGWSSTSTNTQGVFFIDGITPGTYQVAVTASGYISQGYQVLIMAGVTTDIRTIYLTPSPQSTTANGKVTDASTGEPIAGVNVVVVGTSLSVITSSDGTYSISGIGLLEFNIKASTAGYDSMTYHVTTTGYGTYTVNFSLKPIQMSNLRIGNITFSDQNPTQGDTVTISAEILNTGYTQAVNIVARFYDGNPTSGGVQIGPDQTIPSILPNSSATVEVTYNTSGKTGRRDIFVSVDPLNTIKELDETDNSASAYLSILQQPDLFIDSSEITYTPINPTVDVPLTITSIIGNLGGEEVVNVSVSLYNGEPENGGILLNNYTIPVLKGYGQAELNATIDNLTQGSNTFYLVADPDDTIAETNESNNTGSISVDVEASKSDDLSIYPSDITVILSPGATPGDIFTIYATVNNTGSANLQTEVSFFNGDPNSGGVLIGKTPITVPAFGTQTAIENLILPAADSIIHAFVDPDNLISEADETNNIAYVELGPSNLPDFVITENQIRYSPINPTPKSKITFEATVFNYGGSGSFARLELYEGAPENGGVLKGSFSFPPFGNYIEASASSDCQVTITDLAPGEHEFYIVADPNNRVQEINETNNRVVIRITVTEDAQNDIFITDDDITFSPEFPLAGENVDIKGAVHNAGNEPVSAYVSVYNGNPLDGGVLIRKSYFSIDNGSSELLGAVPFIINSGIPEIYYVLDSDNLVQETNEDNNTASRTIDTYRTDLSISTRDISLNPILPYNGDVVGVEVMVHSFGVTERTATLNLYEGVSENGILLGSQDFVVSGNTTIALSFPGYTYPGNPILTAVIENITPLDEDLTNNEATATFGEHIADGATNEGTDFWIVWPYVEMNSANIIIQSRHNADFSLDLPSYGGTYKKLSGTVSPGFPANIPLSTMDRFYVRTSFQDRIIENKGIHITSDNEISVIFHVPATSNVNDESYLALPTNVLGTEYYIVEYEPLPYLPAVYTLVAVEDNTNIRIENDIINLNRGQTYFRRSPVDFTGTYVRSDKPVVVIASTLASDVPKKTVPRICCADSLLEQMLPVSLLGTDYFTAPLYSPESNDVFRILAVEDNTEITIRFKYHSRTIILNAGEWEEFEQEDAMHIQGSKPIMVMQYAKGFGAASVGDPFQMTIIPTDKLKDEYIFYTYPGYEHGDYVTIIAPEPDTSVTLDGMLLDTTSWMPLSDKGNYVVKTVNIGEHVVSANKPVAVYAHGYRVTGSYGYPAGFSIPITNLNVDNLAITPSFLTEGLLAEITSTVTNEGNKRVEDVVVRAYNGDPLNGGVQIGEDVYFDVVYPKESKTVQFTWDTYGYSGTNNIYVVVDPLNTIKESNEADNTTMITVEITAPLKPDPTVTESDIALSQQIVNEGDIVTLSATIKNRGSEVSNIPVSLYLGNPEIGGTLLEDTVITQIIPLNGDVTIDFAFSTSGFMDDNNLFIVIDPENIIDELIEGNNTAFIQLIVNRKRLFLDVKTDAAQYQTNSDVGISVFIKNESILPWSGTGKIYIEDISGNQVANVAIFTVDDLKPLGIEGWHYRAPITVSVTSDTKDAIAFADVNFNDLFSSLGLIGKTINLNSIRVLEFDSAGNFVGEKTVRFEKDSGFDIITNPDGRLLWLIDGTTPANNTRYFYLYFDTTENGIKPSPLYTALPQKGKLIAFSGYVGDFYTVKSNGDGTFGDEVLVDQISRASLNGIVLEDFNNDGYPDIISGDVLGNVYYYQNRADGTDTFLPKEIIGNVEPVSTGNNHLQAITSSDYNKDGNRDFILNTFYSELYVFLGNSDGTFTQKKITYYSNTYIYGKASADFNNDGNIDLVIGTYGDISILFGNGKGEFGDLIKIANIKAYNNIYGVTVGDLDNDESLDIIANAGSDGIAYLLKGMGGGSFAPAVEVPSLQTASRAGYDLFDINDDGILDVLAAQRYPSELFYFEGNGDGSFKTPVNIPTNTYYATAVSVSKTRIDPEIVASVSNPEEIAGTLFQFIWNTGTTPPEDYKVHVTLSEGQGVIAEGYADFEILPDNRVDSKIVTDKVSYNANETVTITSTVTSLSENFILENLTATVSITDGSGIGLYTETNTIPILTLGQLTELKTYWNTGQNPPGTYNVTLEVAYNAEALSTSSATFEITGTPVVGKNIAGSITVSPSSVEAGQSVTLDYSVTNIGNSDIPDMTVQVLVVNPETEEVLYTFQHQVSLPINSTAAYIDDYVTEGLEAGIYMAVLQAVIDAETLSLDSAVFEVIPKPGPELEVTKTIPDVTNLLVWVNQECDEGHEHKGKRSREGKGKDDDEPCIRVDLLEEILGEAVESNYIVYEKKEFQAELRNPHYTDFLILGKHHPLEDHFYEELREQVYSGKGLVSSLYLKHGEHHGHKGGHDEDYDPVFGIKYEGQLSGDEHEVELLDSPISAAGMLDTKGKAVKVEASEETTIAGWIKAEKGHHKGKGEYYPAIVLNEYGSGRAIYYAFDLGLTLNDENYGQVSELIRNSISYVHKPIETNTFYPYQLVPVEIKVKSLGGAFDLRITERYPEEVKLYEHVTGQWIAENPWIINTDLEPGGSERILYYVLLPDKAGTYTLRTELGYVEVGVYNFFQDLSLDIVVDKEIATMIDNIIMELNALSVSGKDRGKVDKAIRYIEKVHEREVVRKEEIEKNIHDILKAIDSLLSVSSTDISVPRLMLDDLLEAEEGMLYYF